MFGSWRNVRFEHKLNEKTYFHAFYLDLTLVIIFRRITGESRSLFNFKHFMDAGLRRQFENGQS